MATKKRCLLWDWTNTANVPETIEQVDFSGPISSVSNWNTWTPPELKDRAPFRPMVRLEAQLSGDDWKNILSSTQPIIHFFNEPERAGITPEKAAAAWANQMLPLRKDRGKKLVGPSCASDPGGEAWLDDFMKRVSANPPDYLGLHYYGTNGDAAIEYIKSMHEKYPELPVIVTEIASISRRQDEVYAFTAQLANWMDEADWIFEYGFFGCMREVADAFVSPKAQLMNKNGSFTQLMQKLMTEQPIEV